MKKAQVKIPTPSASSGQALAQRTRRDGAPGDRDDDDLELCYGREWKENLYYVLSRTD
jgi:hypothetical protein